MVRAIPRVHCPRKGQSLAWVRRADFPVNKPRRSSKSMFMLDPQLAKDCVDMGRLELCRLLLMNDSNYPWFILVPEREEVREIHELADADRRQLWEESTWLARALARGFTPHKLNIAALGNQEIG